MVDNEAVEASQSRVRVVVPIINCHDKDNVTMESTTDAKMNLESNICVVCGFSFVKIDVNEKGEEVITKFFGAKLRLTDERICKINQVISKFDPKEIDNNGVCTSCYRKVEKVIRFQQSSKELMVSLNEMRGLQKKSSDRVKDPLFSENLLMNLRRLYRELALCDMELMCNDGVSLKAHWFVLALHSDYLRKLAVSLRSQNRLVKLDIESSVMRSLLEYCYEGSLSVTKDSCEKIEAAASFLQLKKVLEILKTAAHSSKTTPKHITSSLHQLPISAKTVNAKQKVLTAQTKTPLIASKNVKCVTGSKQVHIVGPSLASAEPKPLSSTPNQDTDSNSKPTEVSKQIPAIAKIPVANETKSPSVFVVDVSPKSSAEKMVCGRNRPLLPKPNAQSSQSSPLHLPLKVPQSSAKGIPLLMLTTPNGKISLHQIGDIQSKGPVITSVVGSHPDGPSNNNEAGEVSSVDNEQCSQAKRRCVSVVNEDEPGPSVEETFSPGKSMISPRSRYFDNKNYHSYESESCAESINKKDRVEDLLSPEGDYNEKRLKIKVESFDEYDDSMESEVSEGINVNENEVGKKVSKDNFEKSLGIKIEAVDDSELGTYTVYAKSLGSCGKSSAVPDDPESDSESSLDKDLCDVGTVHVKTELDIESASDDSSNTYPAVTFQRGDKSKYYFG